MERSVDVVRRNNIMVRGEGARSIVFAHGYGCDLSAWRDSAPSFETDWRVVLFDHVGSGGSDLSAYDKVKYDSLHGYAADTIEVMEAAAPGGAVFVGHSVAAMIGMLAAIRRPELFHALVMVCPSPCYINDKDYVGGFSREDIDGLLEVLASNFLGWSRATAPLIMGNLERPALGEALTSSFCGTDPDIARQFARVTFLSDHREDLPKLSTRTLILQTQKDMIAPVEVGRYMQAAIPASELVIMEATGHCPHMSAPEETVDAIRRFLPR